MPVAVTGSFRVPSENMPAFRPLMRTVIEASRAEPGCLAYSYAEDVLEPGLIRVSELWQSREQLDAHLAAPHMALWRKQREELGMSGREITVFAVTGAQPL